LELEFKKIDNRSGTAFPEKILPPLGSLWQMISGGDQITFGRKREEDFNFMSNDFLLFQR
jgi:hypothetical protein